MLVTRRIVEEDDDQENSAPPFLAQVRVVSEDLFVCLFICLFICLYLFLSPYASDVTMKQLSRLYKHCLCIYLTSGRASATTEERTDTKLAVQTQHGNIGVQKIELYSSRQ